MVGTDIRRTFGLIGGTGEIEEQAIALFFDAHMQAHGFVELDAVAVDKAFALAHAVGPGSDLCAHLGFGQSEQLIE